LLGKKKGFKRGWAATAKKKTEVWEMGGGGKLSGVFKLRGVGFLLF